MDQSHFWTEAKMTGRKRTSTNSYHYHHYNNIYNDDIDDTGWDRSLNMDLTNVDDDRYNSGPNELNVTNVPNGQQTRSPTVSPVQPSSIPSTSNSPSIGMMTLSPSSVRTFSSAPSVSSTIVSAAPTHSFSENCTSSNGDFGDLSNLLNVKQQQLTFTYEVELDMINGISTTSTTDSSNIQQEEEYIQNVILPQLELYMIHYLIQNLFEQCQTLNGNQDNDDAMALVLSTLKAIRMQPKDVQLQQECTTSPTHSTTTDCIPVQGSMSFYYIDTNARNTSPSSRRNEMKSVQQTEESSVLAELKQIIISLIQDGMERDLFVPAHEAIIKVTYINATNPGVIDNDDLNDDSTTNQPDSNVTIQTGSIVGIVIGAIVLVSFCVMFAAKSRKRQVHDDRQDDNDMKEVEAYIDVDDDDASNGLNNDLECNKTSINSIISKRKSLSISECDEYSNQHEDSRTRHNAKDMSTNNVSAARMEQRDTLESNPMIPDWDYDRNQNLSFQVSNSQKGGSDIDEGMEGQAATKIERDRKSQHKKCIDNDADAIPKDSKKMRKKERQNSYVSFSKSSHFMTEAESDGRDEQKNYAQDTGLSRNSEKWIRKGETRTRVEPHTTYSHEKSISHTFDSNKAIGRNEKSVHTNDKSEKSRHEKSVRDSSLSGPFQFLHRSKQPTTTIQQSAQGSFDFFDLILENGKGNGPDQDSHISDLTY